MPAVRNNVTRFLDQKKVRYTAFELPPEKHGALDTAALLGVDPDIVYKTIVVIPAAKGKPILAVIPGPKEVHLKNVARILGEKKVVLPTQREAEQLTGLQAGGISPLALINKGFRVVLDESADELVEIHVSGGQLGLNIRVGVKDLIELTNAKTGSISE